MMRKLLMCTLLLTLTGCIRPHYKPQYVDIPTDWRLPTDEGSTLCNERWWKQFQDPVLDQLIITALYNNQDLKLAMARVREYYARLGVTSADLYPTIEGVGNFTRSKTSLATPLPLTPGIHRINNQYLAYLNLNWELDFWGRVFSATEASFYDLLSQIEARRAVVVTVVASVADAYITLRGLDLQLDISKKTLTSRLESLKLAQTRYELGETSELEVKQAESQVEIAAISLLQLEREIPEQENNLSILLGENPRPIERGLTIEAFNYPVNIPAGLPSELLFQRPDIIEAEDQLIAANARVSEARALFFPQISLTGQYGSQSDRLSNFLSSPAEFWQYGFNAVQTIFDAGRITYLVDETKAIRDEALAHYRQTILIAFREVNNALIATQMNQKLVTEHRRQVQVLAEYYHLATLRYNEGEIDYLNVLDAERALFDAELDLAQAQEDNFNAVVGLYAALGGGWVIDADKIAAGIGLNDN